MQELADWLDVPASVWKEWYALATLERASAEYARSKQRSASEAVRSQVQHAFHALQACPLPEQPLYAAQLFHALGVPTLALRQLHRYMVCSHVDVGGGEGSQAKLAEVREQSIALVACCSMSTSFTM